MLFLERPVVSESEKRELEKFPEFSAKSWFSGEFADGLDRWFTDTVPHREELVGAASRLESFRGVASPKFYGNVADVNKKDNDKLPHPGNPSKTDELETRIIYPEGYEDTETAPVQADGDITENTASTDTPGEYIPEDEPEEEEFTGNIGEFLNNGILVDGVDMYGHKAGIMLFGGNAKQGQHYASVITEYRKALDADVNVYNIVVPTSAEFYLPKKFSKYSSSEKEAIDNIYSSLPSDVITVDAYSRLAEHTDEYIYFRTDHHWTDLGAYYAYTAFCDAAGIKAPAISEYEKRSKDDFVGSLYTFTNDATLKSDPDSFDYYIPPVTCSAEYFNASNFASKGIGSVFHEYASGVNTYSLFLGSDNIHIRIDAEHEQPTGRSIAVFKESYGNAFIPYLVNGFDTIYVIDIRYFGKNAVQFLKDEKVTDVLFINNIFAANTDSLINDIDKLRTAAHGSNG